jgi:nitroimidazol reductase NimA-like FMN-containing flavoprotein (pyridoxamine 5'-phosphate oxidase superfamily)
MDVDADGFEVLSRAEAVALLMTQEVGRLVYTRRALPAVTPVTFRVRDGAVLIGTGSSSALAGAVRGAVVAFQVDEVDRPPRAGWTVTVIGTASLVTDPDEVGRAGSPAPWARGAEDQLIRIPIVMVAGRRLGARDTRIAIPAQR